MNKRTRFGRQKDSFWKAKGLLLKSRGFRCGKLGVNEWDARVTPYYIYRVRIIIYTELGFGNDIAWQWKLKHSIHNTWRPNSKPTYQL